MEKTVKISSKGQITLPRQAREALGSDVVRLVIQEGELRILPVRDLAGALHRYAGESMSYPEAREAAWSEAVRDKHRSD